MYAASLLARIANRFDIEFARVRSEIDIAGSPQRCDYRVVIEDRRGSLFVMENIGFQVVEHKRRIARLLDDLATQSMPAILPYCTTRTGEQLVEHSGSYWQLQPYCSGVAVPRPGWTQHAWRGQAIATFIADLHKRTSHVAAYADTPPFSILRFIRDLQRRLASLQPRLEQMLAPLADYVFEQSQTLAHPLPTVFCHGDLHPLNIIWGENSIRAVIDWEFAGWKPEVYDLANLIGCVGIEDPLAIQGTFVSELLDSARALDLLAPASWQALHPYVLAIRFAWLSEWLRGRDSEMVQMEQDYMLLLWRERESLEHAWVK